MSGMDYGYFVKLTESPAIGITILCDKLEPNRAKRITECDIELFCDQS